MTPLREIRAAYDARTIRVYQAYAPEIAEPAVAAQTFVPPFRRGRMTWVKPSFTWMMYRSGWATKPGQERVLAVDLWREGFEWALAHAALAHFDPALHPTVEAFRAALVAVPVRIQWDPERTLRLEALPWRSLQVGLGGVAVDAYVEQWISRIDDVTAEVHEIAAAVADGDLARAEALRPRERHYPLPEALARRIGASV